MNFLHICAVLSLSVLIQTNATPGQDGENVLSNDVILNSSNEAKKLVNAAYSQTRATLKTRIKREDVKLRDRFAFLKQPVGKSRCIVQSADYFDLTQQLIAAKLEATHPTPFNVSDLLTAKQKEILAQLTGCAYQYLPTVCEPSAYRTITGVCNNRKNPSLGASNTGFMRLLEPVYEDGTSLPRGWTYGRRINGYLLPLARQVSNEIVRFSTPVTFDNSRSVLFMQWGQWVDHDLDLSPDTPTTTAFFQGVDCENSCVQAHPCFPLRIPVDDHRYVNGSECLPMVRSAPVCNLVTPVREQINALTSFMDASQVYASEVRIASSLRNNTNQLGLLAINQQYSDNGLPFLPFSESPNDMCIKTDPLLGVPCFLAGDIRVSEQIMLTVIHTIVMREHNRMATELHKLNPFWSGDILYQETRKIMGCIMQHITYKEWLPLLLGDEMQNVLPKYTSYNEYENPSVANMFANAFRMGHTLIPPVVHRSTDNYLPYSPDPVEPLHKTFFAPWMLVRKGGIDPLLRGMLSHKAKLNQQDQIVDDEVRERLFKMLNRVGFDLPALNIQRGREHGIPGYNAWRRFCGLPAPQNVDELATVLENRKLAEKFINLYGTPENIDLWPGAVSEPLVSGGRIGKLLTCLIGNQLRRTRDGDWFYYENPAVYSLAQRKAIGKVTLAHIICANTKITHVPKNVFVANEYPKDFIRCSDMPTLDLKPWHAVFTDSEESASNED